METLELKTEILFMEFKLVDKTQLINQNCKEFFTIFEINLDRND